MNRSLVVSMIALMLTAGCDAPRPLPESAGFLAAGNDSLAYHVLGAGPDTIVVLAGGPMLSSRYLRDELQELGRQHALLFLEMRGRGDAPPAHITDSMSLATDVEDLEVARAHFQLDSLQVIAHHWGSAILLKHTLRYPGHLARAAVISPFYFKGQVAFELARFAHDTAFAARHLAAREERMDSTNPRGYCEQYWGMAFSPIEVTDPAIIRRLAPAICDGTPEQILAREGLQHQLYLTFGTWDWSDSLPQVRSPVLVLQGKGSEGQERAAQMWAERLPDSRYMALGDAPLFPWVGAERPFITTLDEFFRGAWPATSRKLSGLTIS